jgi:aspartate oxidase
VFSQTTNPSVATGDGMALALRAGATLRDLEFVQFHPTVMWLGQGATGQQPLISEAVRGEGAVLVDDRGARITEGVHELGDLAPRDVVAKAIMRRIRATGRPHVWLDARGLGAARWRHRFPTILETCRRHGVDPLAELIPVVPACHYASGGVATDLHGRTGVPRLYACGEVACSGVHGANRLASNSLLEGLVFAGRIGLDLARGLGAPGEPVAQPAEGALLDPTVRGDLARAMTEGAGVLRSADSLAGTAKALLALEDRPTSSPSPAAWEATSLHAVAAALVAAAARRQETRGTHWREDFPETSDRWRGHLVTTLAGTTYHPAEDE